MSRWRQRLAELRDESRPVLGGAVGAVQNVRNVRNPPPGPSSDQFEQFEQPIASSGARIAPADRSAAAWGGAEEERVALVENDGGIPRAWAGGFAQLDPNRPPSDVPAKRWLRFIDDVGHFLDSRFCAVAALLGWGPYDLFGCDRDRPFARVDQAGLLWVLNGNRLIALAENTATIETNTGARQIYRRRPSERGRALAWDLAREACR